MNNVSAVGARVAHRLLQCGVTLFLLGLLTGFVVPMLANPRLGLSGHLVGVMQGTFLIVLGLVWPRLRLGPNALRLAAGLFVYGAYAAWATDLLAGAWGAGERMMPIAAAGQQGSAAQEGFVQAALLLTAVAMIVAIVMVLYGLRGGPGSGVAGNQLATKTDLP